ncbi:hypothetical protein vseg_011318 [Gypsophila vaccaria]
MLRVASNLKLRRFYHNQMELLIGFQLDQAEIDDLLLPTPIGNKNCTKYNVNIVLRFLKIFLFEGNVSHKPCSYRLKRVARLVDRYTIEIAPDGHLKPSMFVALITAIPNQARDSHDLLYQAIAIYLEVHSKIGEVQKMKVCSVLNYNKLTPMVLNQLSRNQSFPLIAIIKALLHSNPKLISSINSRRHGRRLFKKLRYNNNVYEKLEHMYRDEVLLKELAINEKLRDHFQEIGWTLLELKSVSSELVLHAQKNTSLMSSNNKLCFVHSSRSSIKHLPKLCS